MRELAKDFLDQIKYTDNLDDFFNLEHKGSSNRRALAHALTGIRRTDDLDTAKALARNYFYQNYCMLWNGMKTHYYLKPNYTIEFEEMLKKYER